MAELVNMAGEGMPYYLWSQSCAPGVSPWEHGRQRALREHGAFSYRNTVVRLVDDRVAAALVGYPLAIASETTDYDELPAMFVPLQQLEDMASASWYVNVLATYPEQRGKGFGAELLAVAAQKALATERDKLSLIVSDANHGARRLYEKTGFREVASRPMVKDGWENEGNNWVLMLKHL